jgi:hypothetical protein
MLPDHAPAFVARRPHALMPEKNRGAQSARLPAEAPLRKYRDTGADVRPAPSRHRTDLSVVRANPRSRFSVSRCPSKTSTARSCLGSRRAPGRQTQEAGSERACRFSACRGVASRSRGDSTEHPTASPMRSPAYRSSKTKARSRLAFSRPSGWARSMFFSAAARIITTFVRELFPDHHWMQCDDWVNPATGNVVGRGCNSQLLIYA